MIQLQNRAELLLKRLVNQPSPTSAQDQVRNAHATIAQELTDLGFSIRWHRDPSGRTDDLLVAEMKPSAGPSENTPKWVTFVSHIDTVLSLEDSGSYRETHVQDDREAPLRVAYGPGIIDNKGGMVVLLESLREYLKQNSARPVGLRVVSSPDEENGSTAWHGLYRETGAHSDAVLGFEPALEDGSIVSTRRGNRWYNIGIKGIEAHAGRCRGEEINAAHEAARFVSRLLERVQALKLRAKSAAGDGISANIGNIEGGRGRHNVVCGAVEIKLDTRFSTFAERDLIHGEILDLMRSPGTHSLSGEAAVYRFEIADDCPPFAQEDRYTDVVDALIGSLSELEGRSIRAVTAGGAGDVNHMSRPGLLVMDGLGPVGGKMHRPDEFIELGSLGTRITALARWYPRLFQAI